MIFNLNKTNATAVIFFSLLLCQFAQAQFFDVSTQQLGVENINEGTIYGDGLSFYDFNHDGWDDVTLANGNEVPYFFINNNGQLEVQDFGITNEEAELVLMTLWADYDNDGDDDLLITRDHAPIQLWQNDGNFGFQNVAAEAGLEQGDYFYWGAAFADYNHDGCLDLCVAKYYHPTFNPGYEFRSLLYLNNCDGTFSDVSIEAGFDLPPRTTFQPVFLDYNNDGWEDIFLVIDRIQFSNELFRNNGDGTFTNVSVETGINLSICSMTGTIDDFDNDLDEDIYVTNGPNGNLLMVNYNGENFVNEATQRGVVLNQVSWGGLWIDYDNNSWLDLYVSVTSPYLPPIGNQFFVNQNGVDFVNATDISGFDDDVTQTYMVAMGDLNNDGYYDFVQNNKPPFASKMWQNLGGNNHYISVNLQGVFSNRNGIGSKIMCYAGGNAYTRLTKCGENFTGQNSNKEIFGLDSLQLVDSLIVYWNSGTIDRYYNIPVDQHLDIVEGASYAVPFEIITSQDVLCAGDSATLDAGNYLSYLWNTGDTIRNILVTDPGIYYVNVTDVFGNNFQSNSIEIFAESPPDIAPYVQNISCYGLHDGAIVFEQNPESPFIVQWGNDSMELVRNDLSPGSYYYIVVSENGCTHADSVAVEQPSMMSLETNVTHNLCFGVAEGTISWNIDGGVPPYEVVFDEPTPENLPAGNYQLMVYDVNNCSISETIEITQPDSLYSSVSTTNILCFGINNGTASAEIGGGTAPYYIDWGSADSLSLGAGEYDVPFTDHNSCQSTLSFTIEEPDQLTMAVSTEPEFENGLLGSATIEVSGGTQPYQINWSVGVFDQFEVGDLSADTYNVLIYDANGCEVSSDFVVDFVTGVKDDQTQFIHVYPNPADEYFIVKNERGVYAQIVCYDLYGKRIYSSMCASTLIIDTASWADGIYIVQYVDGINNHNYRLEINHR